MAPDDGAAGVLDGPLYGLDTRVIWSGSYQGMDSVGQARQDGYYDYTDAIPVLFTTLERLKAGGPRGAVGGADTASGKTCPPRWSIPTTSTPGMHATENADCAAKNSVTGSVRKRPRRLGVEVTDG
ncbi:hypothetical protein ACFY2M_43945 [Streptomyces sp. NPDC001276]|uniref:hypothetical protein n=1 Tax=Streptomyces sp. NPDC001276 TaxID=3364555 RepID=UPI0036B40B36